MKGKKWLGLVALGTAIAAAIGLKKKRSHAQTEVVAAEVKSVKPEEIKKKPARKAPAKKSKKSAKKK
ncbi:hypothetical protein JW868_04350 [Candidatus Woesearchaeota archaeon]|nr:hypothetical protein [Candidatus Woesearchaeota archaeon]